MTIAQAVHRSRSLLGALLVLAAVPGVYAQEARVADSKDVESVDAIMAAVYDVISGPAGEERDWDRMRSLFLPEARLIPSFVNPGGEIGIQYLTLQDWIDQATGYFADNSFFEVEIHRVEERYGHIAHAFSTYESRTEADGAPFARGINSFQLLHDGERWWVVNIYWQGETDEDPIPAAYLP